MYRFVSVLLCCVLLCASCASPKPTAPVTSGFRCVADIVYNDVSAQAVLDRTDASKTIVEFTSPTELVGLAMEYENGALSASYAGFRVQIDEAAVPVANVAKTIADVLARVSDCTTGVIAEYSVDGGTLQVDPMSGLPMKMEFPSSNLIVSFSSWECAGVQH